MRRRVSIARALIARPHRPLRFSDRRSRPITSQTIIASSFRLRDVYGVTALLATHRLQTASLLPIFISIRYPKKVRRDSSPESAHVAPTRFSSCAQARFILRERLMSYEVT